MWRGGRAGGVMESLASILRVILGALGWLLGLALRVVRGLATVLLAIVLLFEEWGWRPLAELLALLARFRLWARLEGWIAGLSPYRALVIFALPTLILLPVKLGAFYLLSQGKVLLAGLFLAGAKIVSTALVARIFLLTRPALMRLGWFARLYNWVVPWQEAIFARIRATWPWRYGRVLKTKAVHETRKLWVKWRPWLIVRWLRLRQVLGRLRWEIPAAAVRAWQHVRDVLRF